MKKMLTFLLALLMIITTLLSCSKDDKARNVQGQLIVGSISALSGDFMSSAFSNNSADKDIRDLLHGYSTVSYTKEGTYEVDKTVVKNFEQTDNSDGSKTYTFILNDNLIWNDNTSIKAKDYVFGILLNTSPQFASVDADISAYMDFIGYEECRDNKATNGNSTAPFKGVKLINDMSFSITIKSEKLPFFYDLYMAGVSPVPIHIIAPNADVKDTENGSVITGDFTSELLQKTIADPTTGYRYNPKVTCGAYNLESFDRGTKQAVLVANQTYVGDYNKQKASIEKIVCKGVKDGTQIDELAAGSVDLIQSVSGSNGILPGLDLVDAEKVNYISYPRAGYGKISFVCDMGPTQFVEVRQSIAHLLDVPEFARQYSGGYAEVVYGMYGAAQWMYQENKKKIDAEFDTYALDIAKAEELLIEGGWILNKAGTEFVKGTDDIRYKDVAGKLMPLEILWCNTPDNPVSALISQMLPKNMTSVGMKLTTETVEFPVLLENYQRSTPEPKYHMYNLATGFYPIFDPETSFRMDDASIGYPNSNCIKDQELYDLSVDLRKTPSSDRKAYSEKWYKFQKRWNELMPDIPLYSDEYHDFFNPKLKGYEVDPFWTWTSAILYAYIG